MANSKSSRFEATSAAEQTHKGFFSRKTPSTNFKTDDEPTVPEITPVSFSQLFRSVESLSCLLNSILTFDQLLYKI